MAFQPNQEYKAEISSYQLTEDNDGKPEIHIGVTGDDKSAILYKLKFGKDEEKKRSLGFAVRFGADRTRLSKEAYLEQWGHSLIGKDCFIRTKQWEMNGKTGVFVAQISPKAFPPVASAVAKAFGSLESLGVSDEDLPY